MRQEQLETAEGLLADIPNGAVAVYLVGLVYQEQGNMIEAMKCWEKAVQRNPKYAAAYDSMGNAFLLKGEHETAIALFRKAIELDPKLVGVGYRLAQALIRLGKTGEAISALQRDTQVSPKASQSYTLLGEAYLHQKEYAEAMKYYGAAIEIQPDSAEAYYGLATACARLGRKDQAKAHRDKFQQLKAKVQKVGRDRRSGFDPLVVTRRSVAHTHTDIGRVYRLHGFVWRAQKLWRRAAELDPKNATCRFELAAWYESQKQLDEALKMYEQLTVIEPQNGFNHFQIGNLNARLTRFDPAEKAFAKAIELAPQRPEAYRGLAHLYAQTNRNLPQAIELARKAVELQPSAMSYFVLGNACDKNGDHAGALRAIERAMQLEPGNTQYKQAYKQIKESN